MSLPQPAGLTYPLDYMDKGCILAMNEERGGSGAVVWEHRVRGAIDPDAARQAVRDLMCRYPICRSTVRALDPKREAQTLHYVVHDAYDIDDLFRYVDVTGQGPEALEAAQHEVKDRLLDPFVRFPFQLTIIRSSPEECWMLFHQHHCIADARGMTSLMGDYAYFLRCAESGTRPEPERLQPYPKVDDFSALGISRAKGVLWGLQGFSAWFVRASAGRLRPITPSFQNRSRDYSGGNRAIHRSYDAKLFDQWKPLRKRHGIGVTAILAAAQFEANRRWNLELGIPSGKTTISLIAETRPRDPGFRSFANHFGGIFGTLDMSGEPDPLEMILSLNRQFQRQSQTNEHKKRLIFERAATRALPLEVMRNAIWNAEPAINLNFSNATAIPYPTLEGSGWRAVEAYVTTATMPPYGTLLTMVQYNGQIFVNHNYKPSIVTREQAIHLADHYDHALYAMQDALAR